MHPVGEPDRGNMMRVRLLLMTLPAPPPWVMLVSLLVSLAGQPDTATSRPD